MHIQDNRCFIAVTYGVLVLAFCSGICFGDTLSEIRDSVKQNANSLKCGHFTIIRNVQSYDSLHPGLPAGLNRSITESVWFDGTERYRICRSSSTLSEGDEVSTTEVRDRNKHLHMVLDFQQAAYTSNYETEYSREIPFAYQLFKGYGYMDLLHSESALLAQEGSRELGMDHIVQATRAGRLYEFHFDPANLAILKQVIRKNLEGNQIFSQNFFSWEEVAPGVFMATSKHRFCGKDIGGDQEQLDYMIVRRLVDIEITQEPDQSWFSMDQIPEGFTYIDKDSGILTKAP